MIKERQNPSPMKELDIKSELIQEKKHLGRSLSLELKDVECRQKKKKKQPNKIYSNNFKPRVIANSYKS